MSEPIEAQPDFREKLFHLLCGNIDAVNLCYDLGFATHLWDDLIDCDKVRTKDDINTAFTAALGTIHLNPFYQANIRQLSPILMSACLTWQSSTAIQSGDADQKLAAFVFRQGIQVFMHYCMYLTGGYPWVVQKGSEMLTLLGFGITGHYRDFLKEMAVEPLMDRLID